MACSLSNYYIVAAVTFRAVSAQIGGRVCAESLPRQPEEGRGWKGRLTLFHFHGLINWPFPREGLHWTVLMQVA